MTTYSAWVSGNTAGEKPEGLPVIPIPEVPHAGPYAAGPMIDQSAELARLEKELAELQLNQGAIIRQSILGIADQLTAANARAEAAEKRCAWCASVDIEQLSSHIVQAVFNDAYGRSGFDAWWDGIDEDIQREATEEWRNIVCNKIKQSSAPPRAKEETT